MLIGMTPWVCSFSKKNADFHIPERVERWTYPTHKEPSPSPHGCSLFLKEGKDLKEIVFYFSVYIFRLLGHQRLAYTWLDSSPALGCPALCPDLWCSLLLQAVDCPLFSGILHSPSVRPTHTHLKSCFLSAKQGAEPHLQWASEPWRTPDF